MVRKKGFKHTKETRRKMRKSHLGKKLLGETKIKIGLGNKGKKRSKETRKKISLSQIGRFCSEKTRKKMSKSHKGMKKPWSKDNGIKTRFKKGHKPWCTGMKLKSPSEETKRKMSEAKIGKETSNRQRKLWENPEYCEMMINSHLKYYKENPEAIEEIKKRRAKQIFPIKDTKIEVKIQNFLKTLGIEFFTHQHMNIKHFYQCDMLILSMNLIIECDGDFIHCNPIKYSQDFVRYPRYETKTAKDIWELDNIRKNELIEKGFKVLRLWESDINKMSINGFKKTLNNLTS